MATYKYKTSDIAKRLIAAEGNLSNIVKRFNLYLSNRAKEFIGAELAHDFKAWAKERGVEYNKVTISEVLAGYGKYEKGKAWSDVQTGAVDRPVLIEKVARYKLNADGTDFVFQETEDKRGHKQYNKVVEFYTFEQKSTWTIGEVAVCVGRCYEEKQRKEVTYKMQTAYELIENDLVESDDETMQERAKMTAAEEAALLRMDAE